jgi:hypothetical protein
VAFTLSMLHAVLTFVRTSRGRCLLGVVLAFLASRAVYFFYFGVRFSDNSLHYYLQYVDPVLLKSRLLESVTYLWEQPPLFNLFLGLVLKAFPDHSYEAFHAIFLGCGLALAVSMFLLTTRMGIPPLPSALLATLFAVHPATVLYENWLFYTYPIAALFGLAALFLHRYLCERRVRDGLVFFALLTALSLIRVTYHPFWLLLIAAAVFMAVRAKRKQVLLVCMIPVAVTISLLVKNYVLFGSAFAGKWTLGANLVTMAGNLPPEEHKRLAREGHLSLIYRLDYPDFKPYLPPYEKTGVAVLDEELKSNGNWNMNHLMWIDVGEINMQDAKYIIMHYPDLYLASLWNNCKVYFEPAGNYYLFSLEEDGNIHRLQAVLHMSHLQEAWFNWVVLLACVSFGAAFGVRWLARRIRRGTGDGGGAQVLHEDATAFTTLFMVFNIVFVSAATVAVAYDDHQRYRFEVMSLYFPLFAMLVWSLWNSRVLAYARRPGGPVAITLGTKCLRPSLAGWLVAALALLVGLDAVAVLRPTSLAGWLVAALALLVAFYIVGGALLVCLYAVAGALRCDPTYRGQPLSYWVTHLDDKDAGPALADALNDPDADVRWKSAMLLAAIGPEAFDAVSALSQAANDPDAAVRRAAAVALQQIEAVDAWNLRSDSVPAGSLDLVSADTIGGWAWDEKRPANPVKVDIYDGDILLATVPAVRFRQDLVEVGIGNGRRGFMYATPHGLKDGKDHTIRVKVSGTDTELAGSPKMLPAQ